MKKEKPSQPSTSRSRSSVAPAWILVVLVAIGALWFDRAPSRRGSSTRAVPSAAPSSPWTGIADWPAAMQSLAAKPLLERQMEQRVDMNRVPGWSSFSRASLAELNVRRRRVRDWGKAHHPAVSFFPQIHGDPNDRTPERAKEVEAFQDRLFQRVRTASRGVDVVVIEEYGCAANERLTPEAMVQVGRVQLAESGVYATEAEVRKMMQGLRMASMRMILEVPEAVVDCGEEWPNQVETHARALSPQASPDMLPNLRELVGALSRLRSEIILIRALEWLAERGGSTALIIQGMNHLSEIERLAPEYGIRLTVMPPD